MLALLLWDMVMAVQENVTEQQKQIRLLACLVCIQELYHVDWMQMEVRSLETGLEKSEQEGTEGNEEKDGSGYKEKGK